MILLIVGFAVVVVLIACASQLMRAMYGPILSAAAARAGSEYNEATGEYAPPEDESPADDQAQENAEEYVSHE